MSAVQDEITRKLEYIERLTGEAKKLVTDAKINGDSQELLETIKNLSETNELLIRQLVNGGKSQDPETEDKFTKVMKLYKRNKEAELLMAMKEIDQDLIDDTLKEVK